MRTERKVGCRLIAVIGISLFVLTGRAEDELPEGFRQTEYVQGDGAAYIDLGFKMTEKDAVDVVAMVADDMVTKESGGLIYGTRTSGGSTDTHYWGFNADDGYVILEFYGNANGMRLSFTGTTDDKFAEQRKFIGKKVHCHNSATHRGFYDPDTGAVFASGYFESKNALPSGKTFTSANNCGLFTAFGTFWSVDHAFNGRIYSFIVTRDGEPFATLVPCIRTRGEKKGEVGFYDAVSGNFVGNTNSSGAFIPGAEVESSSGFAILLK